MPQDVARGPGSTSNPGDARRPGEHHSPLLERELELSVLGAGWDEARSGGGSAWMLAAEGGGGKTRLLRELAALWRPHALFWGAADPVSPPDPYVALTRAIPGWIPAATRGQSAEFAVQAIDAAADGPALIVLEDLHFADAETVGVAVRLVRECPARPWLVLLSFRPNEGLPELERAALELTAQGAVRRLDLAPLSLAGVAELARAIRGKEPEPAVAAALHADSGGNPWFAESLLRGSTALSAAHDRLQLRLNAIDRALPGAYGVVTALAPAAHPLPFETVAELCGGDSRDLRRVLAGLRDAGVIEERDAGWAFRQDLMRQVVLMSLISADRRDAHRALAEALERGGAGAAEMAMHYAAANDGRARAWSRKAAEAARAVGAHQEALAQLERLVGFELDGEERQWALAAASGEALLLGRAEDALRLAGQALQTSGGSVQSAAQAAYAASRAAAQRGDAELASERLRLAARLASDLSAPGALAVGILCMELALAMDAQDPERLATAMDAAHAATRELTAPAVQPIEAFVEVCSAAVEVALGKPEAARRADAALGRLEAVPHPPAAELPGGLPGTAWLRAAIVRKALLAADLAAVETLAARSEPGASVSGGGPAISAGAALEHALRGRYADAAADLPGPRQAGAAPEAADWLGRRLAAIRGGPQLSGDSHIPGAEHSGTWWELAVADERLERAMWQDRSDLLPAAQSLAAVADRRRCGWPAGIAAVASARAGATVPATPPAWLPAGSWHRVLWTWAEALRQHDHASARAVAADLDARGLPFEAAMALRDGAALNEAYRAFRNLDATAAREETAAMLRSAGQPIPRRTRASVAADGLTETEREICRLVANGARNEEIASDLTVSIRTVESHLSNIYRKAGCRGRVALASWWRERSGH